ncbi:hypothetical protein KU6B_24250 [Mameliella alba]|nr:hypothetical protein KU6B_24250 [Mameliella alba]
MGTSITFRPARRCAGFLESGVRCPPASFKGNPFASGAQAWNCRLKAYAPKFTLPP